MNKQKNNILAAKKRKSSPIRLGLQGHYGIQVSWSILLIGLVLMVYGVLQVQFGMQRVKYEIKSRAQGTLFDPYQKKFENIAGRLAKALAKPLKEGDISKIEHFVLGVYYIDSVTNIKVKTVDGQNLKFSQSFSRALAELMLNKLVVSNDQIKKAHDFVNRLSQYSHDIVFEGEKVGELEINCTIDLLFQKMHLFDYEVESAFEKQIYRKTFLPLLLGGGLIICLGWLYAFYSVKKLTLPIDELIGNLAGLANESGHGWIAAEDTTSPTYLKNLTRDFVQMQYDLFDRQKVLKAIHKTTQTLSESLDQDVVLTLSLNGLGDLLKASKGIILKYRDSEFVVCDYFGFARGEISHGSIFSAQEGLPYLAIEAEATLIIDNLNKLQLTDLDRKIIGKGTKTLMCVPLLHENKIKGLIFLLDRFDEKPFGEIEKEYAEIVASSVALTLDNIERIETERKRLEDLVAQRTRELAFANDELYLINQKLELQTIQDGLTGLYNFRYFNDQGGVLFGASKQGKSPLACVFFDIDRFKGMNDNFSHQFGDYVLKEIGKIMKENSPSGSLPVRYAGDEFVILLPDMDYEASFEFGCRLCGIVHDHAFQFEQFESVVTISLGISCFPHDPASDLKMLVKFADKALYLSKDKGRNACSCYKDILLDQKESS